MTLSEAICEFRSCAAPWRDRGRKGTEIRNLLALFGISGWVWILIRSLRPPGVRAARFIAGISRHKMSNSEFWHLK